MAGRIIAADELHGTWKLVVATAVDAAGNDIRPPYGPAPMGRLVLTECGRMMAVICDGRREIPGHEKRAYASYAGNYVVADNCLATTVDAALDPARIGGRQLRRLEFRDGLLVLIPPRRADGEQRELFWERTGPA